MQILFLAIASKLAVKKHDQLGTPATACSMSASFVGKVPAEIASLIFGYAIDPTGPPVLTVPTEWPRRIGARPDGCKLVLSCFLAFPC